MQRKISFEKDKKIKILQDCYLKKYWNNPVDTELLGIFQAELL